MPTVSGAFSALMAPGLRKVYYDWLKKWSEEYSSIANVLTSKRQYEEDLIMAGLGAFIRKPESQEIHYDTGQQGPKVRYTHSTFALGFRITREAYDDDLYGILGPKMSKSLAQSAIDTVELQFGAFWDDIFAGSTYKGFDGLSLINTAHITTMGATMSNRPATDADLGVSTLRAALVNLEKTLDERGFPRMKRAGRIIIDPTFQFVAKELTQSQGKPYTADNELNAFKDMGLSYEIFHYQSTTNSWAVIAPKGEHDINYFWRQRPILDNSDDFDTKDAKFTGYFRNSMGFGDWRGVYGSI